MNARLLEVSIRELRAELAEVIYRVKFNRQRTIITRNHRKVAALISLEDLQLFDALQELHRIDLGEPGNPRFGEFDSEYLSSLHRRNPQAARLVLLDKINWQARHGEPPAAEYDIEVGTLFRDRRDDDW